MSILDQIVVTKREEITAAKQRVPLAELRERLPDSPDVPNFFDALANGNSIRLIAEVKKASPSKGIIREDFDPVSIAKTYEQSGAACISVLTDETYFQGHLDYLSEIRNCVQIPLLRKDFILDEYQIVEARLAGASAVLLIAECLDDCNLRALHNSAIELGLTPLVEFYEPENLTRVLEAGAVLIGVNNRDLKTFKTDLNHTIEMRRRIPPECLLVGESGIHSHEDVKRLAAAGVEAILVGEHLMASQDIGDAVRRLLGTVSGS